MGQYNKNNTTNTTSVANNFFVDKCEINNNAYYQYGCATYALTNKNPDGEGTYWKDFLNSAK